MDRPLRILALSLLSTLSAFAQSGDKRGEEQKPLPPDLRVPPAPVRTPEQEAATFKLAPGFRAELIAADPLIGDPIAMQFAPDGKLWVLEMRGYMPNVEGTGEREPVCTLATLTDSDGDGRYDKRVVFADKLVMPRAFSLVGDGVLLGEPPMLWFLRDINGDGVADQKTEVASDYGNITNPEHNANGLMWALDNWIYSANHTARFRWLGNGKFARETTVTRGQWGITQDDAGRIYYNSNSDPLRHDAVPSAYLKRNPGFTASGANVQLVPSDLRIWPSRMTPGVNRGYRTLDKDFKLTSMTAASGPVVYRGSLLPKEFYGDAFVPEPSANLIKRIKLFEKDGLLTGANAYEGTEFMTSTDERFRPVNLYNGPDGALYVVDFYRGILQHRIYITSFLRKQVEDRALDRGLAHGRIWRVVPQGAPRAKFNVGLVSATSAALVGKLSDANGWVRDTAQRLLVERQISKSDDATVSALRKLVVTREGSPIARLHALWALEGSGPGALDRETVVRAFADTDARVAAAAVRMSERFKAELVPEVAALAKTRREPQVRLQLAFTLGEARSAVGDAALRELLRVGANEKYLAEAIVSGLGGRELLFLEAVGKDPALEGASREVVRQATGSAAKAANAAQLERLVDFVAAGTTPDGLRMEMIAGLKLSLPRSPEGKTLPGRWPVEPRALVALAAKADGPASAAAAELLEQVRWPGKPGAAAAVRPLTEPEQLRFKQGETQWMATCAACHQPNGQGLAGLAPSLVYSKWVLGDARLLARIILNGKVRENLIMPPWKAALNDDAVAAVMTFLRRSWEHDADPVTSEVVRDVRREVQTREEPFTDDDLQEAAQSLRPMRRR